MPRRDNRPLFAAALVAALIIACGPRAQHQDAAEARDLSTISAPSADTTIAAATHVTVGPRVELSLEITNLHDRAIELRFPTGQTHEFAVYDSTGKEVWRWSSGRLFTQTLQARRLGGRDRVDYSAQWDAAGRTGRYTAVATLASANHPVQERVDFVLP
ncbi:MAG TPA: BsuPI-related putative proteinase inhibitor [Gemmatimonadaceae bacterium]|nr:BsuPI-related putative proteinase inhibitor [Gemmatimonadaceae bacterium]